MLLGICCVVFMVVACIDPGGTCFANRNRTIIMGRPTSHEGSSKYNNWRQCKCGVHNEDKDTEHETPEERIINGVEAVKHEFPWLVNIWVRKYSLPYFNVSCGGTIISTKTIITAAHCLYDDNLELIPMDRISILVSDHDTSQDRDGDSLAKVCGTHPHTKFSTTDLERDYDIGFITLCKELTWSKYVSPICLPNKNYDYEAREAIVAGWGYTTLNDPLPNDKILQKVTQITMTNAKCITVKDTWVDNNTISERQICAMNPGVSTCNHDDGGPLMVQNPDTKAYTLVGIVSLRQPGCITKDIGIPEVYQRVQADDYAVITKSNIRGTVCEKDKPPAIPKCKCGVRNPTQGVTPVQGRIIGGQDAERNEFPWLVRFVIVNPDGSSFLCGGSIISTRTILTAAHCLIDDNGNLHKIQDVIVADHDKSIDGDGEYYAKVCSTIPHMMYRGPNPQSGIDFDYDVGILTLCEDLKWSLQVSPICLPDKNVTMGFDGFVAGWGSTQSKNTGDPKILKETKLYIYQDDVCVDLMNNKAGQRQICAGLSGSTCSGDSGGPLIVQESGKETYTMVGIASYEESDCSSAQSPAIFQRVTEYLAFIKDHMKGTTCDTDTQTPPDSECKCGVPNTNKQVDTPLGRIVNGEDAVKHEFPWLVNLMVKDEVDPYYTHYCGGTIISSKTIITAANCFYRRYYNLDRIPTQHIRISIGDHDTSDGELYYATVCDTLHHPNFQITDVNRDYDYGFVQLCDDLTWSKYVSPICLPEKSYDYEAREAIVAGWGYTKNNDAGGLGDGSVILQKGAQKTISNAGCVKGFWVDPNTINERQICAMNPNVATCNLDEGGPLMVQDPTTQAFTLVGVVSRQVPNCETNTTGIPEVYQRVQANDYARLTESTMIGTVCNKAPSPTPSPTPPPIQKCMCGISNPNPQGRIINGQNALKNEFPWMVQLVHKYTFADGNTINALRCGGSIISSRTIATAAHCFDDKKNPITEVVIADHNKPVKGDGEFSVKVCGWIGHPKYISGGTGADGFIYYDYDIGLVFLCEDLIWSKVVSPICLPNINFDNEGREAIVTGWGSTKYHGSPQANILQKTTLTTLSNDECVKTSNLNSNQISQRQICAVNANTDACSWDSGGPLAVKDPAYQPYTLVGIRSYGIDHNCSTSATGIPSGYTRVTEMLSWTLNNMKGTTCIQKNIPQVSPTTDQTQTTV